MASPRIEYAVLPAGEGPGQDRCFTADGLVVVLDGASAIDPMANPDATQYVDTLGPLLIAQMTGTPGIDLRDALAGAIGEAAKKLALVPGTAPSSTVSIVRWGEEVVDVLVLGDSPVLVHLSDGRNETVVQHPMDHIAPELRLHYRQRLAAGRGYDDDHRGILAEIQRREAPLRNHADGYFIAEAEPDAAWHARLAAWPSATVTAIIIYTDGAERAAGGDTECIPALARLDSTQLSSLLASVHTWESDSDPDGQICPRSKRHDDKTIACVSVPVL